jgi:kojibiose phosphorylase
MSQDGIHDYARYLDLQEGCLKRRLRWSAPDGTDVELHFERFASLADEHVLALSVQVTPLNRDAEIRVRALLDSRVDNDGIVHWNAVEQRSTDQAAHLLVETRHSGKRLAMSLQLDGAGPSTRVRGVDCPGCPGLEASVHQKAGEPLQMAKLVAVYTSHDTGDPLAAADEKVTEMGRLGYEALRTANANAWAHFWSRSDVIIRGDDEAQAALRHALFQLRIAAPSHNERVSIGAKTLSGFGYRGHVFWDTEIFVLPFFTYTQPELAHNMLMYRCHTLPGARRKAAANGYRGAQFAWESAETGDEVTPPWLPHFADPSRLVRIWTGDIELHISSDVAYAAWQYWRLTADDTFWRDCGAELVLETALFWGDRVEQEGNAFVVRDVIGPDEYHEHVDNNVFTNYMVRWHLETALDTLTWLRDRFPERATELLQRLALTEELLDHWRNVARRILILQEPESGLMEQFEGFFELEDVDWAAYADRTRSMQELLGIEGANKAKVLKQPDVIALLALLGERFDENTWQMNWNYYAPLTDHPYGSSLGPAMHAWVAARLGKADEAYEHFMRAARADLNDVRGNASDGIHAASAGGLWQAVVLGFAGLQLTEEGARVDPVLPEHWNRLSFHFCLRNKTMAVDITREGGEIRELS